MKTVSQGNKTFVQSLLGCGAGTIQVSLEKLRGPETQALLQFGLVKVDGQVKNEDTCLVLTPKGKLFLNLARFDLRGEFRLTSTEMDREEIRELIDQGIAYLAEKFEIYDMFVLRLNEDWLMLRLIIDYFPHKYTRVQLFYQNNQKRGLGSPLPALKSLVEKGFVRTFLDNGELYIELI